MGSLGGRGVGGGAGGKVGLPALGVSFASQQTKPASLFPPSDVAFKNKKAAVRELPHPAVGHCKLKDYRRRAVDFDGTFLKFHEGLYGMESLESKCLVNKWSTKDPVDFYGFSLLKNIRHRSIVTLENFYDESGQPRIVLSWIDGSLTAWLRQGGNKKCFQTAIKLHGNCPSIAFRRMIIDTCRALEYLFSEDLYPIAIKESDLFLCNEKEKGEGNLLKMLICNAELLSSVADRKIRKCKLWADVKTVFQDICKQSDRMLTAAAESFVDFIGSGNVDKLESFPDIWTSEKKACYLFSLIAADRSVVRPELNKMPNKRKFAWPSGIQLITDLLKYEMNKKIPTNYDVNDGYDYLRLCRNVIKHWKKFRVNVRLLKDSCPTAEAFLEKMEEWNPTIWCNLYKVVGWPECETLCSLCGCLISRMHQVTSSWSILRTSSSAGDVLQYL